MPGPQQGFLTIHSVQLDLMRNMRRYNPQLTGQTQGELYDPASFTHTGGSAGGLLSYLTPTNIAIGGVALAGLVTLAVVARARRTS